MLNTGGEISFQQLWNLHGISRLGGSKGGGKSQKKHGRLMDKKQIRAKNKAKKRSMSLENPPLHPLNGRPLINYTIRFWGKPNYTDVSRLQNSRIFVLVKRENSPNQRSGARLKRRVRLGRVAKNTPHARSRENSFKLRAILRIMLEPRVLQRAIVAKKKSRLFCTLRSFISKFLLLLQINKFSHKYSGI